MVDSSLGGCALRLVSTDGQWAYVDVWLSEGDEPARVVEMWSGPDDVDLAPVLEWVFRCSLRGGLPPFPEGWRLMLCDDLEEGFADCWPDEEAADA